MNARQKWRVVFAFEKCGNASQVARQLKVDPKTVERWAKRERTTQGVEPLPRSGRPPVLDHPTAARAVELLLSKEHGTAARAAHALQKERRVGKLVHPSTIIRHAKAEANRQGHNLAANRSAPEKQLTPDTKRKRSSFARRNLRMCWRGTMFSDRKRFLWSYPGSAVKPVEWTLDGQHRQVYKPNKPQCVNLYAAITPFGVTRCHLAAGTSKLKSGFTNKKGEAGRNITGAEYQHVLGHTLLPDGALLFSSHGIPSWSFQQDNDPAHKKAAIKALALYNRQRSTSINLVQNWLPNSPDLNPIENVWGFVHAKVNARACNSFEQFQQVVLEEVQAVPRKLLKNLYSSMPGRMAKVIKAEGGKIKY
jgi:hypothetical protein